MLDTKKPNVDLQDPAFDARVISVLDREKKKARKQLIKYIFFLVGGAFVGYAYAHLSLPLIQ